MRLFDFHVLREGDFVRAQATVAWEESARANLVLFVEAEACHDAVLSADISMFVAPCLLHAWRCGEQRLQVEGSLCPILTANLSAAVMVLQSFYPEEWGRVPRLEATGTMRTGTPVRGQAVAFLSCGIDSLWTLRWNRLNVPADHPLSIQAALVIGFDLHPASNLEQFRETFRFRHPPAFAATNDLGVELIEGRTNLWWLDNDGYVFDYRSHGALFSSVAAAFAGRFSTVYIAGADDLPHAMPMGSHPYLDHHYSSGRFRMEHNGVHMTRLQKVACIADWPAGLQNMRVCQRHSRGEPNCGECEKCLRTMLALIALGKLAACAAFPQPEVSPELLQLIEDYGMVSDGNRHYYREMAPALEAAGRSDLAAAVQALLDSFLRRTPYAQSWQHKRIS